MPKIDPVHTFTGSKNYIAIDIPVDLPVEVRRQIVALVTQIEKRFIETNKRLNYLEGKLAAGVNSTAVLGTDTTTLTFAQGVLTDNS